MQVNVRRWSELQLVLIRSYKELDIPGIKAEQIYLKIESMVVQKPDPFRQTGQRQ